MKLLGNHIITHNLPTTSDTDIGPLYWVAGRSDKTGGHIFKASVYNSTADVPVSVTFEGVKAGTKAQLTVLTGPTDPYGYNDPWTRENVVKTSKQAVTAGANGAFSFKLPPLSVAVLDTTLRAQKKRDISG